MGKIGIGRNKDYYSYKTNCANFVSQCVYAGGIEQNDSWYSNYLENEDEIAPAWRLAQEQYNYFSDEENGYINGDVIKITSADEIVEAIDIYDIQKGDLMYFIDEGGKVHHATIISSVTDSAILYSGNTTRRFDYFLEEVLEGNYGVYIVRIKDQIEAVSEEDECG